MAEEESRLTLTAIWFRYAERISGAFCDRSPDTPRACGAAETTVGVNEAAGHNSSSVLLQRSWRGIYHKLLDYFQSVQAQSVWIFSSHYCGLMLSRVVGLLDDDVLQKHEKWRHKYSFSVEVLLPVTLVTCKSRQRDWCGAIFKWPSMKWHLRFNIFDVKVSLKKIQFLYKYPFCIVVHTRLVCLQVIYVFCVTLVQLNRTWTDLL